MEKFLSICELCKIMTKQGKVSTRYKEIVKELDDGYKFPYIIQIIPDNDKLPIKEVYPKKSRLINDILYALDVKLENLPKEEKRNVKTVTYTLKLNDKQKDLLEYLKSNI